MKYIRKGKAPQEFRRWLKRVHGTWEEDYRELRREEKEKLQLRLVEEQGWLCAYTMKRIDIEDSHIEHIRPEALCRAQQVGSDLDYNNIIACFPREGMKRGLRYGAQLKSDWWDNDGANFISPLHQSCERKFRFDLEGKIFAMNSDVAANITIKVLGLNHKGLADDRKRVITEFVFGEGPLSEAQAIRIRAQICNPNADGKFNEFCIAVQAALDEYLKKLRKAAQQKKYARRKG